jgi:hypothetical protein
MHLQQGLPAHRPTTRGIDSILCQDSLDRVSADCESQIREGSRDSRVSPSRSSRYHRSKVSGDTIGESSRSRALPSGLASREAAAL